MALGNPVARHRSRNKWRKLPACDARFCRKLEAYATETPDSCFSNAADCCRAAGPQPKRVAARSKIDAKLQQNGGQHGRVQLGLVAPLLLFCHVLLVREGLGEERHPETIRIVFGGDVMLDNSPGHALRHGTDPFAELAPLLNSADLRICNLECTVAWGGRPEPKPFVFKARPDCLPLLKRYFSAVCLANNHACDYGKTAFLEELGWLEKERLPYFGGGRDRRHARQPLVLERQGMRVALLGYCDFPPRSFAAKKRSPGTAWLEEETCLAEIKAARREQRADVVIPFLHWGDEEEASPLASQRRLARQMIDAGADAVVGGHAHVTQTIEIYRGRPIIYSLGNLVFDYWPCDPEVWTGWLVRLTFQRGAPPSLETFVIEIDKVGIPHLVRGPGEALSLENQR